MGGSHEEPLCSSPLAFYGPARHARIVSFVGGHHAGAAASSALRLYDSTVSEHWSYSVEQRFTRYRSTPQRSRGSLFLISELVGPTISSDCIGLKPKGRCCWQCPHEGDCLGPTLQACCALLISSASSSLASSTDPGLHLLASHKLIAAHLLGFRRFSATASACSLRVLRHRTGRGRWVVSRFEGDPPRHPTIGSSGRHRPLRGRRRRSALSR